MIKRQAAREIGSRGDIGWASPGLPFSSSSALIVILVVLFFGPLIAPLFQATQLPLVADSGALARDLLARYICPTPARSYVLLGFPMAVCARCWGATIGLWAAWMLFRPMTTDHRPPTNANPFVRRSSVVVRPWSVVTQWLHNYLMLAWPARLLMVLILRCSFSFGKPSRTNLYQSVNGSTPFVHACMVCARCANVDMRYVFTH